MEIKNHKKTLGISRNKVDSLLNAKTQLVRKKNIFKYIGKEQPSECLGSGHDNTLLSATTQNSSSSSDHTDHTHCLQIYEQAKKHLQKVSQYREKMASEIKLRYTSIRQTQIKKYDDNICRFSSKAVEHLVKSEKLRASIKKNQSKNRVQMSFFLNMEKSLAQEIRQVSLGLRSQQKDYYDKLKVYENGTANLAIQLRTQDREKMRDDFEDMEICETQYADKEREQQVGDLIKSINKLNHIYRELNNLVIEQGSLIDRIDFNIEQTYIFTVKGKKHLQKAQEHADCGCAQKTILVLASLVIILAIVMGFKLMDRQTSNA